VRRDIVVVVRAIELVTGTAALQFRWVLAVPRQSMIGGDHTGNMTCHAVLDSRQFVTVALMMIAFVSTLDRVAEGCLKSGCLRHGDNGTNETKSDADLGFYYEI
jgi:hypothetical protein